MGTRVTGSDALPPPQPASQPMAAPRPSNHSEDITDLVIPSSLLPTPCRVIANLLSGGSLKSHRTSGYWRFPAQPCEEREMRRLRGPSRARNIFDTTSVRKLPKSDRRPSTGKKPLQYRRARDPGAATFSRLSTTHP